MSERVLKRTTVYFEPALHKAIRLKSAHTRRSMSDIVNDAVRSALREDEEDLSAFEDRITQAVMSYEVLLNKGAWQTMNRLISALDDMAVNSPWAT